eukprot:snap_masked-scaffold_20-processed-gene-4.26-mRNA-1 protein AED:1.00 eAED:1.00 QI:0/-1/0/0/-1/1/1/0/266
MEDAQTDTEKEQAKKLKELKIRVWKQSELQFLGQYFVVNALFSTTEWFEIVLGYIPFYYSFKFLVLLYLFFPQLKGSEIIYFEFVLPQMEDENIELFVDRYLEGMNYFGNIIISALVSPISAIVHVNNVVQKAIYDTLTALKYNLYTKPKERINTTYQLIKAATEYYLNIVMFWRTKTNSEEPQMEYESLGELSDVDLDSIEEFLEDMKSDSLAPRKRTFRISMKKPKKLLEKIVGFDRLDKPTEEQTAEKEIDQMEVDSEHIKAD